MPIGLSHGGQTHYRTEQPIDQVLVGTANGVAVITRSSQGTWSETRRSLEGKHVSAIAVDQEHGTVLAGTHGQGLYASEDDGQSWERRDVGIASGDVYSLAI